MSFLYKLKNVLAFFQQRCFKILAMSTFKWLALLVAADLQVCGVCSSGIDACMKRSFTHLLVESIAAALKGFPYVINKPLVSVSTLVLQYVKYFFKNSTAHNLLFWYAL